MTNTEKPTTIAKYAGFRLNGQPVYTIKGENTIFTKGLLKQMYGENFVLEDDSQRKVRKEWSELRSSIVGVFQN